MPILLPEVQCYPSDLMESAEPGVLGRQWWLIRTRTRQEKSLARDLVDRQIPFYLPQVVKTSVVRGRKRSASIPLFSGYLFLFGDEQDRYRSMATNRVAQALSVTEQQQLLEDLRQIHSLIQRNAPLTTETRLQAGDRVRVKNGPFAGVEGTIVSRCRKSRIVVAVRLIQQGVSLEVEDCQLEPI